MDKKRKTHNSFIIYHDTGDMVIKLSDESAGRLFKGIFQYAREGTVPDFSDDMVLEMVFIPIKNYLDRDAEAYEQRCEENRKNGMKGGRPPKEAKPENEPSYDTPDDEQENKLPFDFK